MSAVLTPDVHAIHTPTVVQGEGGGLMGPLPAVFDMLQYFESILPLVDSL